MEPVMLYCAECCERLARHAIVGECGHAFCYEEQGRKACVPTTGRPGAKSLSCPLCNCARPAWRVVDDAERMPPLLRDLVYARISYPITGISKASVKRDVEIALRRREGMQRHLAKRKGDKELDECCEMMVGKARVRE